MITKIPEITKHISGYIKLYISVFILLSKMEVSFGINSTHIKEYPKTLLTMKCLL